MNKYTKTAYFMQKYSSIKKPDCTSHPFRHPLPLRHLGVERPHGMDASGVRSLRNALPLQQGHRVQQLPLAIAYHRAASEDRGIRPSHPRCEGIVSRLLSRRPLRPDTHAKRAFTSTSPERPSRDVSLWFLHQDDGE